MNTELPQGPFDILYADPPWTYQGKTRGGSCSLDHYPSLTTAELCALPIPDIVAPKSLCYLWTTGPRLPDALRLLDAWQYKYGQVAFVWHKLGGVVFGQYTLTSCEFVLVGRRGGIPAPQGARNLRQFVETRRGRHSEKPSEVRDAIAAKHPTQRKLELFARTATPGWEVWGNEV